MFVKNIISTQPAMQAGEEALQAQPPWAGSWHSMWRIDLKPSGLKGFSPSPLSPRVIRAGTVGTWGQQLGVAQTLEEGLNPGPGLCHQLG